MVVQRGDRSLDEGCRRHHRKTHQLFGLRLPGTASPDAAARSECWAAALGMAKEILCVQFR